MSVMVNSIDFYCKTKSKRDNLDVNREIASSHVVAKNLDALPPLARNLKRRRKAAGMSQERLAAASQLSSVKMIESGKASGSAASLQRIASALGVTIGDLFVDSESAPIHPALAAFLASPAAKDTTPEEKIALRKVSFSLAPGKSATETTYYLALQMLRSIG